MPYKDDAKLDNEGAHLEDVPGPVDENSSGGPNLGGPVRVVPGNGQGGDGNPSTAPDGNPGGRQGAKHP